MGRITAENQGATSLQNALALLCVASETQARGAGVICHWRLDYYRISAIDA
jgi:hypothetical protein